MEVEFIVADMTCGHCVQAITEAVRAVAPDAAVRADLAAHRVSVAGAPDGAALEAAIREAGYDVQAA